MDEGIDSEIKRKREEITVLENKRRALLISKPTKILAAWQGKLESRGKTAPTFLLSIYPWSNSDTSALQSSYMPLILEDKSGVWSFEKYITCKGNEKPLKFFAPTQEELMPPGGEEDAMTLARHGVVFDIKFAALVPIGDSMSLIRKSLNTINEVLMSEALISTQPLSEYRLINSNLELREVKLKQGSTLESLLYKYNRYDWTKIRKGLETIEKDIETLLKDSSNKK